MTIKLKVRPFRTVLLRAPITYWTFYRTVRRQRLVVPRWEAARFAARSVIVMLVSSWRLNHRTRRD